MTLTSLADHLRTKHFALPGARSHSGMQARLPLGRSKGHCEIPPPYVPNAGGRGVLGIARYQRAGGLALNQSLVPRFARTKSYCVVSSDTHSRSLLSINFAK